MSVPVALVSGASGVVGPALVRKLSADGWRVRTLTRRAPEPELLPRGVDVRLGDLRDTRVAAEATAGVDTVFHLAAVLHRQVIDAQTFASYRSVNVEGTRTLLDAARRSGARRFVYCSTINVYGPTPSEPPVDEDRPPRPASAYAESKLSAEHCVLDASGPVEPVVLRLAAVYGPRLRANYATLLRALRYRLFVPVGRGDNRRTLVHVEDVARAVALAGSHPGAQERVFNVTDGRVHALREVIEAISAALGRRPPPARLPAAPIRVVAVGLAATPGLRSFGAAIGGMLDTLLEDVAVSGARIRRDLGFVPAIDLRTGWAEVVAALERRS